tara:strand:- start:9 stop:185 length:177 start_codon:yes stop_codon:yes gene_type:complete
MDVWNNAVNSEFIDNLIDELERLKSDYKDADRRKEYYQEVGRIVCAEIQATYDKDVEL